jgi:hypothetical protein
MSSDFPCLGGILTINLFVLPPATSRSFLFNMLM